ncbi:hypothetical protein KKD19_01985 [Patescibacteria group bacterium]|nr:hypothetical protein [Patescibacteria group bacterium]MBU4511996.1 hypothetical protein [Patescibacteria group bacterium]MCG2693347.1 hypothetical protein [Candidatus Parcubacteria bacterium]
MPRNNIKNNKTTATKDSIVIKGARVHNLKNIDVEIPRNKFVVITGLSGSGKSSLAFDTIYAEGQRRYVESLSSYARQFLGLMDKPDVDQIDGLAPAISIDQRNVSHNPRSTVGTTTEIYDYLRLLFARIGKPHCPKCGDEISRQSNDQIIEKIFKIASEREKRVKLMLLAPIIRDKKGEHKHVLEEVRKAGYVRVRFDGTIYSIEEAEDLTVDKMKEHSLEVVVDRLEINSKPTKQERSRLAESLETILDLGNGLVIVCLPDDNKEFLFSQHFSCPKCDINLSEIEPRSFSFNSPYGACPVCSGLGTKLEVDSDMVIPNKNLSISQGAIRPWSRISVNQGWYFKILEAVAKDNSFSINKPVKNLTKNQLEIVLYGTGNKRYEVDYTSESFDGDLSTKYEGVIPNLERRYKETQSDYIRIEIEKYMRVKLCPSCGGKRLRPEALAVTVGGKNISEVTEMTVEECKAFFAGLAK